MMRRTDDASLDTIREHLLDDAETVSDGHVTPTASSCYSKLLGFVSCIKELLRISELDDGEMPLPGRFASESRSSVSFQAINLYTLNEFL